MKKHIIILVTFTLALQVLLNGCRDNKTNSQSVENTDINTIKTGKYFGEPYKLHYSFIPILSLEDDNTFKFELSISKSLGGTYTIDNNKLVLSSNDGKESYTLEIINNTLITEEEIPNYVRNNSKFKLPLLAP